MPGFQQAIKFEDLLHLTYLSESQSEHPLAQAIVHYVKEKKESFGSEYTLNDFKNINGEGITAKIHVFKSSSTNVADKP